MNMDMMAHCIDHVNMRVLTRTHTLAHTHTHTHTHMNRELVTQRLALAP
jgi:hypothetical protein